MLFAEVLTDEGYLMEGMATAHDALARLTVAGPNAFDIVLSTPFWHLRADPYAFLEQLCAVTTTPIVICTRAPTSVYADYRQRGYAGFLPEPFSLERLIALAASLCTPDEPASTRVGGAAVAPHADHANAAR